MNTQPKSPEEIIDQITKENNWDEWEGKESTIQAILAYHNQFIFSNEQIEKSLDKGNEVTQWQIAGAKWMRDKLKTP